MGFFVRDRGMVGIGWFVLAYSVAGMLFAPSVPMTIFAGIAFGFWGGLLAVTLGSTVASLGGYWVSRLCFRAKVFGAMRASPRFLAIDSAVSREGWKIVGLLRVCPIPFGLSNYMYGLTGIRAWNYLIATWLGMLPGHLAFVYLGSIGKAAVAGFSGRNGASTAEYFLLGFSAVAAVAVITIVGRIVRRALAIPDGNPGGDQSAR